MDFGTLFVPQISVSLAPPEETPPEPYSPFKTTSFQSSDQEDSFRPSHLTPPPVHARFPRHRVSDRGEPRVKPTGQGINKALFEALLNCSKEMVDPLKKPAGLRKEVAVKVHKNKQAERRALFLSKVLAPPSPTATTTPATPPDSPALFHYSLPSPGLVSPIAHFESLQDDCITENGPHSVPCKPWVEQVDFKLLAPPTKKQALNRLTKSRPPSLDEISSRLNSYRASRALEEAAPEPVLRSAPVARTQQLVVGRLRMPLRSSGVDAPTITVTDTSVQRDSDNFHTPPKSPLLTSSPALEVTTPTVLRMQSTSPTELTKVNLLALNHREIRSSTMLSAIRRRTQSPELGDASKAASDAARRAIRRHSAPPESQATPTRKGFEHPILALPGAF